MIKLIFNILSTVFFSSLVLLPISMFLYEALDWEKPVFVTFITFITFGTLTALFWIILTVWDIKY